MSNWQGGDVLNLGPSGAIAAADYALSRFAQLGLDLPAENRLVRAQRLLGEVNALKVPLTPDLPANFRRATEAQWTVFDFYLVARSLGRDCGAEVLAKVGTALGGSDLPEQDQNHLARNTEFELVVAAFLTMGSIPVVLDEPDLAIATDLGTLGVAAKRVQTPRKIRRRMREAAKQIERSKRAGLVAINVDSVLLQLEPVGDAGEKGSTVNDQLGEVHRADDELMPRPLVLGRVAFGRTARWTFESDRPVLQQDWFRQYVAYNRTPGEAARLESILEAAETSITHRLAGL